MKFNNKKQHGHLLTLLIFSIIIDFGWAKSQRHAKEIQDLKNISLIRQQQSYFLKVNIGHHQLKLEPFLENGRTWIKDPTCQVCDSKTEQCKLSCFTEKQVKISCDSSFCSKSKDYQDEESGLTGFEAEVFLKLGNDSQILMPLIFAVKISHNHNQSGVFNIFDPESSFNNAIIAKSTPTIMAIHNIDKLSIQQHQQYKQKQGKPISIKFKQNLSFEQHSIKQIILHHTKNTTFIDMKQQTNDLQIQVSLGELPLKIPVKIAKKIEKYLADNYFKGKKCKLLANKFKCEDQIHTEDLFEIMIELHIGQSILSFPMHMLFTACSKYQCKTLIDFDQDHHKITIGYVLWELYNVEYHLDSKQIAFHLKNTQWDTIFNKNLHMNAEKQGFFYTLVAIIYHTLRYICIVVFWLAVLSLGVNCIVHWRRVLKWLRNILVKVKGNRQTKQESNENTQFEISGRFRRIDRIADPYEDQEFL